MVDFMKRSRQRGSLRYSTLVKPCVEYLTSSSYCIPASGRFIIARSISTRATCLLLKGLHDNCPYAGHKFGDVSLQHFNIRDHTALTTSRFRAIAIP